MELSVETCMSKLNINNNAVQLKKMLGGKKPIVQVGIKGVVFEK